LAGIFGVSILEVTLSRLLSFLVSFILRQRGAEKQELTPKKICTRIRSTMGQQLKPRVKRKARDRREKRLKERAKLAKKSPVKG
jgi:hypothetical protein